MPVLMDAGGPPALTIPGSARPTAVGQPVPIKRPTREWNTNVPNPPHPNKAPPHHWAPERILAPYTDIQLDSPFPCNTRIGPTHRAELRADWRRKAGRIPLQIGRIAPTATSSARPLHCWTPSPKHHTSGQTGTSNQQGGAPSPSFFRGASAPATTVEPSSPPRSIQPG